MSTLDIEPLSELTRVSSVMKHSKKKKSKAKNDNILNAKNNKAADPAAQCPIVMLRGFGRGQHHWSGFKSELQKAFPKRDIILIDLPGNGALSHLTSPNNIKVATDSITTQLELQGVNAPCDFIGLSLGGMIALYMMENTAWVRRACVINTSVNALSLPMDRMKPMALIGLIYSRLLPTQLQEKLMWQLTVSQPIDKAILKNWVNVAMVNKVTLNNLWRQSSIARSYNKKPILGQRHKELLILSSKHDNIVNARCSIKLAKHTNAQHKTHKSAGHDLPLDDPQWVASCTYQFFR